MKPIETRYKGYRFRSRLEARYATLFDALGWEWEYEKEGFEFSCGDRYLPDFWIPKFQTWIEVKGQPPALTAAAMFGSSGQLPRELELMRKLRDGTGRAVLMVGPDPTSPAPWIGWDWGDSSGGHSLFHLALLDAAGVFVCTDREASADECAKFPCAWYRSAIPRSALEAFRSARFEYGESGSKWRGSLQDEFRPLDGGAA